MFDCLIDALVATEIFIVTRKDDTIFASFLDSNAVIGERVRRVEIEYKQ